MKLYEAEMVIVLGFYRGKVASACQEQMISTLTSARKENCSHP